MTKTVPRSKALYCDLAANEITLDWNENQVASGMVSDAFRIIGMRSCTGVGTGTCPVKKETGEGWGDCPHLPKF